MAGITLEQAQAALDSLVTAAANFTGEQEIMINGRRVIFTDLAQLTQAIAFWENQVKTKSPRTALRSRTLCPGW
jgi:hypothetical protein